MATLTMTAPTKTDVSIHTAGSDTVLVARIEQSRTVGSARVLAQRLAGLRMPGIEGVNAVDATVMVSFDPGTITRSHLELLIHDAAQHI